MVHLRYDGRSFDVSERQLGVQSGSSDGEIRRSVARHLGVDPTKLRNYVVDRSPSGDLIFRPEAVYG